MSTKVNQQDFLTESQHYLSHNWTQVSNFIDNDAADQLYKCLCEQDDWNLVCNIDSKHLDMNYKEVMNWSPEQRTLLNDKIFSQAALGFQYYYASIPVFDLKQSGHLPDNYLNEIYQLINSDDFLDACRLITQNNDIKFADVQVTKYSAGHFLTSHDDNVDGKNRIAAYVLNLSKNWKPDWGGGLVLHEAPNHSSSCEILFPSFNALNIFSVPQQHSVSQVTPFAQADRYSITGWLRS